MAPGWLGWLAAGLLLALFGAMKSYALHPQTGDEGIYFYYATRSLHGVVPYRDYVFAHPPLQLLVLAPVFALLGSSFLVGKLVPPALGLATAALLLVVARRIRRESWVPALASLALYVTTYDVLRVTSHYTGGNLGALLGLLAMERLTAGRPIQAGLVTAMTGMAALYAVPGPVFAGLVLLAPRPRDLASFLLATVVPFLLMNGAMVAWTGWPYVEQVYLFHLAKPPFAGGTGGMWKALVRDDTLLTVAAGLSLLTLLASVGLSTTGRRGSMWLQGLRGWFGSRELDSSERGEVAEFFRARGPWIAAAAGLVGQLAALSYLKRIYTYYFAPAYPLMALVGGGLAWYIWEAARARRWGKVVPLAMGLLVGVWWLTDELAYRRPPGSPPTKRYQWFGRTYLGPVDGLVRTLLWEDEREIDRTYNPLTRYLWHESRYSEALPKLASYVREHGSPSDQLFGDSMSAPVVALMSDRLIAGDLADTNRQHYTSGTRDASEDIALVDGPNLRFVVCRGRVAVCAERAVRVWLSRSFRLAARVKEPRRSGTFFLFERKRDVPARLGATTR